ncbi:FecCD family ABC transporter permease [Roseibium algae]|uniref:Iron ABC transporter permease n=1 Tax=Roseibium algae TaxID=3123038 RepID=A0ABU8TJG6_9HYPH
MRFNRATDGKPILRLETGLQVRLGNLVAAVFLAVLTLAMTAIALGVGSTDLTVGSVIKGLLGHQLSDEHSYALWDVRMPRILIGFMAGWLVAMTGAMLQSLARNPLADPGLFGLSQGSMVMIMLLMVLMPDAPKGAIPLAALVGGLSVALLLIWLVGGKHVSGLAILLMGIAVETVLSSVSSLLILYTPKEMSYTLSGWLAGSLFQASWSGIAALFPWFLLSVPAALFLGRALRCYDLGNEMAMALGVPIGWSRPVILIAAVLLSSASVTAVGPLVFLGIMAPHLSGFLSPATGRARLFLSGLTGGVLVVGADCLTRGLSGEIALPIGLSLSLLGVPLFIIALRLRALRNMTID